MLKKMAHELKRHLALKGSQKYEIIVKYFSKLPPNNSIACPKIP